MWKFWILDFRFWIGLKDRKVKGKRVEAQFAIKKSAGGCAERRTKMT